MLAELAAPVICTLCGRVMVPGYIKDERGVVHTIARKTSDCPEFDIHYRTPEVRLKLARLPVT